MNVENEYYVYAHYKKGTDEIFYVGKGKGNRAYDYHRRSDFWKKIKNKHGFDVKLIKIELSEYDALLLESKLIKKYGKIKDGGLLCNLTDGFDGLSGFKHNEKTKLIMRDKAIGRKNITDNGRDKIRMSNKNRVNNPDSIKRGALKRVGVLNKKSKIVLNIETGVYYDTLTQASLSCGINIATLSDNLRGVRKINRTSFIYA